MNLKSNSFVDNSNQICIEENKPKLSILQRYHQLQRLIVMNQEVIKFMTSRLQTYTDIYMRYFRSQLSYSAPKNQMSHDLFEDMKKF